MHSTMNRWTQTLIYVNIHIIVVSKVAKDKLIMLRIYMLIPKIL